MTIDSLYLVLFASGLVLCLISAVSGFGHLHFGHFHRAVHGVHRGSMGRIAHALSGVNGFTVLAFVTWFGGAGYLLERYSPLVPPLVFVGALLFGFAGAFVVWTALFKVLLPRERVLSSEDTSMPGILGRVSGPIRSETGIGEIIFSQMGARHASAARSEDGLPIERGAEVVVVRYESGIAYVRRWEDLS